MPPYAESFCEALAKYMREVLPITHPTESKMAAARKRPAVRKSRNALKNRRLDTPEEPQVYGQRLPPTFSSW
jgi:hypothetical protein